MSVDAFLEHRPEFLDVEKIAIGRVLVPCERSDLLFEHASPHLYDHVFRAMNAPLRTFGENRLTVITFNYDRSFEQYLRQALRHTYSLSGASLQQLLDTVPVFHVYGSLGSLTDRIYDTQAENEHLLVASRALRVVHERGADPNDLIPARDALMDAERIAFLGFGYDQTNLARIGTSALPTGQQVIGSAMHLTPREKQHVRDMFSGRIELGDSAHDALTALRHAMILEA